MKREWLINLRIKKNLSQEELANMCGVTQVAISSIENGKRRPSPELAKNLSKILKFNWTKFYENQQKEQGE